MAGLAALVARLADSAQGAAIGGGAVAGDVAQLAASVALHGLSLTVACEVIGPSALVAGGRTGTAREGAAVEGRGISATGHHGGSTAHGSSRTHAREMTRLAAVVAAATGRVPSQTKRRTVGLDMAQALAVVALLGLGGARQRAAVGLVAGLLAVVAEPLSR